MKATYWHLAARPWAMAALALLLASSGHAGDHDRELSQVPAEPTPMVYVTRTWGLADVNRCVEDPIGDLESAIDNDPSYLLGYRSGTDSCSVPSPTEVDGLMDHRQSIQRIFARNKNWLVVSSSLEPAGVSAGYTAGFDIVELGSRTPSACILGSGGYDGVPFRPSCADRVAAYLGSGSGTHRHAGGIQALGQYVIVAYENNSGNAPANFRIADLSDPAKPYMGEPVTRQLGTVRKMSTPCLTKLADGRFLVLAFGNSYDHDVELFLSNGTTMSLSASFWTSLLQRQVKGQVTNWKEYENLQCITGCDGRFFVLGTHRNPEPSGEDWADLFQVVLDPNTYYPTFYKVANRHMYCDGACAFKDGAGPYVDPNGRLYLYGVEGHENGNDVQMREFRTPSPASCIGSTCIGGACYPPDGAAYISHFTGPNCTGIEYYYTPYFSTGYKCRPWSTVNAQCAAPLVTDTVRSWRGTNGSCNTQWTNGNILGGFARVYRVACGEAGCFNPDGTGYFSHYEGPNCTGSEFYFTPYFGYGSKCRPGDPSGAICGAATRTLAVRSTRDANGMCVTSWPNGNVLYGLAKVYR